MSLPSLDKSLVDSGNAEAMLLQALKTDLPLAVMWFYKAESGVHLSESPGSNLGKQIVRICAADGLRRLVEKYVLGGKRIVFANCCDLMILSPNDYLKFDPVKFQIETQNGVLNHADC